MVTVCLHLLSTREIRHRPGGQEPCECHRPSRSTGGRAAGQTEAHLTPAGPDTALD